MIFRVLFAVLSFFGGVGLLMYLLCWLLMPEADVAQSALDKGIHQLRIHRVPPWLVIAGGVLVLWLGWFSWWAPGPTFPALALIAVVLIVLVYRLGAQGRRSHKALPDQEATSAAGIGSTPLPADGESAAAPNAPLIAPLNDTRRSMQEWLSEASEAHRKRVVRRRPIKVAVGLALVIGWAIVALFDAFNRAPFPAYVWVGLAVLTAGLLVSLATRRVTLSLLAPIALLSAVAVFLGGTSASLKDGSGKVGWTPTSATQLIDHRQFAGQATLDLSQLPTLSEAKSVQITQAAGEVRLLIPATMNATVVSDVHIGDIRLGTSQDTGKFAGGFNVHLELPPATTVTGRPVTIHVTLTVGHVQIDRIG